MGEPQKIILENAQSVGDIICLSAVPRDLHRLFPGQFEVHVSTSFEEIWLGNPYCNIMPRLGPTVEVAGHRRVSCHYPSINRSNRIPRHFIGAFHEYLSQILRCPITPTEFKWDLYVTEQEKAEYPIKDPGGEPIPYWLMIAGGKHDYSAKWPVKEYMQQVVWRFRDTFGPKVRIVQVGAAGHVHPEIYDVIRMVGKTTIRQMIQLCYHAQGAIAPVTFLPHMMAAIPPKNPTFKTKDEPPDGSPENLTVGPPLRPCVTIAGGREPVHWEAYPGHQFLHTIGAMECCAHGGCWRSRAMEMGDNDEKDKIHRCLHLAKMRETTYAKCMTLIRPEEIFSACMKFYEGGALKMPT